MEKFITFTKKESAVESYTVSLINLAQIIGFNIFKETSIKVIFYSAYDKNVFCFERKYVTEKIAKELRKKILDFWISKETHLDLDDTFEEVRKECENSENKKEV